MSYEKIKEHQDMVKDSHSGAILMTNIEMVKSYKARKNDINRMKTVENKIIDMESDLKSIKILLEKLLDGNNK